MTLTSTSRQQEWRLLFAVRGCPNDLIRRGRERPSTKSRAEILKSDAASNITNDRVPFVTTFHPMNLVAEKIISRKFRTFREDSTTRNIFHKPPLKAFRRAKNLKDLLHRSSLLRNLPQQPPGTLPCNRTVCRTCPHVNSSSTITTQNDMLTSRNIFPASRNTWFIACLARNVHRQFMLERLDAGWRTAFENTAEM